MRRHRTLILLCIAAALVAGSCTLKWEFVGTPVPRARIAELAPGMPKREVLNLLGPPDTVGLRMDGSVFIYRFRSETEDSLKLSAFQASFSYDATVRRTERVVVFFDKKGRLTDFASDRLGPGRRAEEGENEPERLAK
jgi:outer membrane protein assembly factor BamE (lipoprotein component of BamABCDE complex)